MVASVLHRRSVLAGLAAAPLLPSLGQADAFIDLAWVDLLPENQTAIPQAFLGLIDHDQAPASSEQPQSSGVRTEYNGQTVRLPGFVVPIDQSSDGVTAFILVPYAGACIHVPPPPANQLVFVTTQTPYPSKGLYEPVNVTGQFAVSTLRTHLAEVGYALSADAIEPFRV